MGLTNASVGKGATMEAEWIVKQKDNDCVLALAGNPNVGKSTVFNGLTGMNQHTGNWPGKTVTNARGVFTKNGRRYILVDLPGTYSLMAHSKEEEVARNYICFGDPDAVVIVCDATCLERNLNLVLQTIETGKKVLVCVNLMDEARRKHIRIDLDKLSDLLGTPVVGITARKKDSLDQLTDLLESWTTDCTDSQPIRIVYQKPIEQAIEKIMPCIERLVGDALSSRWLSLRLLCSDASLQEEITAYTGVDLMTNEQLKTVLSDAKALLENAGFNENVLNDAIVSSLVQTAEKISKKTIFVTENGYEQKDRRIDRILTGKITGYAVMLALLALIFWITISGANYPSSLLSTAFFRIQVWLSDLCMAFGVPDWLHGALVLGVYRVLAWVISVMLPPMAIFFPLFTLLEDIGYLPRIAFNLDKPFKRCRACGKQALTMCMGFGCNAAGVVGCRIIDSPRERLLAILTNNFVPCNGRFPTLISLLTMFFVGTCGGATASLLSALMLTGVILIGILTTFLSTRLLSSTVLKGMPSSFTLELPPYRRPQIGKILIRSVFDRTLFVLGRAAAVAAPAGLIIWLMANVTVSGSSLLCHCADFLDPFARLMGLDGVILIAFILGFPANEIVIPIIIMAYMSTGSLTQLDSLVEMKEMFLQNGWTALTALNTMLFSLMHWPCSTTLMTIKKETGSLKWTLFAALLPTAIGVVLCLCTTTLARLLGCLG